MTMDMRSTKQPLNTLAQANRRGEEEGDYAASDAPTSTLMFSLSEQSIYRGARPEIMVAKDNTLFSTPQGWLLIIGEISEAWLWHPLNGETISLPPIHDDHFIPANCKCLLTHYSVADPDCAVVLLDVGDPNMWFCRVSGGQWGHHTYHQIGGDIEDLPEDFADSSPPPPPTTDIIGNVAALRGKVHFTCIESKQEKICIIDLDFPPPNHPPTAVLQKFEVPNLEFPQDMCSGKVWLVESQEELFAVCICFLDFDPDHIGAVLVYKMDFSVEDQIPLGWRRVHSVGDRAFLLSGTNMATWCSASGHNFKGNAVYFLKNFRSDDGELCVYDLQEQTMEIVRVHDQDLVLTRTKPYWINVPPC
ncbi:hypothetical protein EJB05_02983, partial [Eragrostis curvula]